MTIVEGDLPDLTINQESIKVNPQRDIRIETTDESASSSRRVQDDTGTEEAVTYSWSYGGIDPVAFSTPANLPYLVI